MNEGIRTAPAADGGIVILAAWCPTCREEVMPSTSGSCSWCGSVIVDEDRLSAKAAIAAEDMKGVGPLDAICKVDGCDAVAVDKAGPYGRLCAVHKEEKRSLRAPTTPAARSSRSSGGGSSSLVEACRKLVPVATKLERARVQLAAVPSGAGAKAAFDEAARRASTDPSTANLDRLQEATKALRSGAPRRSRLEEAASAAAREFKAQLAAVLEEARAA